MKFLVLLLTILPVWSRVQARSNSRIIGGQAAIAGQFPYAAAIYKTTETGKYFCGGVLVSSEWVLTAGQCVDGAILFTIYLGTTKLEEPDSTIVTVSTDTYVLHPGYNPETLDNDIGLIKLRLPVSFSIYLDKINLPSQVLTSGETSRAYGWGQVSDDDAGVADHLNWVELSVLSNEECKITYGNQITDNMVCLSGNYNEGACVGDTGSAAIQHAGRGWTIVVGISTFVSGNGCESTDPSGYTRVYHYNDWIRSVING
ncbi:hypothetical protein Zmor_015469 [Zophobas morio]|uniref:Peptidase S1 domain-containing protein n=1 Tax=Zophobas morio TaxID=2755281 RepID=A0AA38IGW2_9CUCU|nr:hypothetical protein Zmor_015469 [Zophobas morio]